jgi:hypothetical protein
MHERRDIGRSGGGEARAQYPDVPGVPPCGGGDAKSGAPRARPVSASELFYVLGSILGGPTLGAFGYGLGAALEARAGAEAEADARSDDHSPDEIEIKEAEYRIHDDPKA